MPAEERPQHQLQPVLDPWRAVKLIAVAVRRAVPPPDGAFPRDVILLVPEVMIAVPAAANALFFAARIRPGLVPTAMPVAPAPVAKFEIEIDARRRRRHPRMAKSEPQIALGNPAAISVPADVAPTICAVKVYHRAVVGNYGDPRIIDARFNPQIRISFRIASRRNG